jgi:hypothetical protein
VTERCNCTADTIDGLHIESLQAWELALRNAAHGHYAISGEVVAHAVRHIEALRRRVR